jgi:hypothetical protein
MRVILATALMIGVVAVPAMAQTAPAPPVISVAPAAGREALSSCPVLKTSGEDRLALARWAVGSLASARAVGSIAKVDTAAKDAADREVARLFTRLLTVDCFEPAHAMFKSGDRDGLGVAFNSLGTIAFKEVMNDPEANAALGAFTHYINADVMKKLQQ